MDVLLSQAIEGFLLAEEHANGKPQAQQRYKHIKSTTGTAAKTPGTSRTTTSFLQEVFLTVTLLVSSAHLPLLFAVVS